MYFPPMLVEKGAKQMTKAVYDRLGPEILKHMQTKSSGLSCAIIPQLSERKHYNSINIIGFVPDSKFYQDMRGYLVSSDSTETVATLFQVHTDPSIVSFVYKGYQVNMVQVPTNAVSRYHLTSLLYSYNGLGVLLHRMFRSLGLTLSVKGLFVNMEDGEPFTLHQDVKQVCTALGLNFDTLRYDIRDNNSVCEFLFASPYASLERLKPLNEEEEALGNKYSLVAKIAEYYATNKVLPFSTTTRPKFEGQVEPKVFLRYALNFFGLRDSYRVRMRKINANRAQTWLFGGTTIRDILVGISGVSHPTHVAEFTTFFRTRHRSMDRWLSGKSKEQITEGVAKTYKDWIDIVQALNTSSPKAGLNSPIKMEPISVA